MENSTPPSTVSVTIKNKFPDKLGSKEWITRPQSETFNRIFKDLPQTQVQIQQDTESTTFLINGSKEFTEVVLRIADILSEFNNTGVDSFDFPEGFSGSKTRFASRDILVAVKNLYDDLTLDLMDPQPLELDALISKEVSLVNPLAEEVTTDKKL